jgi:small-conductance mechanosensitive channel
MECFICGKNENELNNTYNNDINKVIEIIKERRKEIKEEIKNNNKDTKHLGTELGILNREIKLIKDEKNKLRKIELEILNMPDIYNPVLDNRNDVEKIIEKYIKRINNKEIKICPLCKTKIEILIDYGIFDEYYFDEVNCEK